MGKKRIIEKSKEELIAEREKVEAAIKRMERVISKLIMRFCSENLVGMHLVYYNF